ncbi:hypothetical protein Emin_1420 [Elusimicrobium minutum Pei191]|uniref:Lipoprotein n=1 Tax=Elusimicrobium minutum (strain Pei191) TaxID=445932 RepID=B2KEM3_ELUMP|nr:hypothetical protein [Elusimicrobium minutum]ACC98969.1 hypothetical protein Emin_1420 [Elusimicrobium minutum Pei191]
MIKKSVFFLMIISLFCGCFFDAPPNPRNEEERQLFVQTDKNFNLSFLSMDKYVNRYGSPTDQKIYIKLRTDFVNSIKKALQKDSEEDKIDALQKADMVYVPALNDLQNKIKVRQLNSYLPLLEAKHKKALAETTSLFGEVAAEQVSSAQNKMTEGLKRSLQIQDPASMQYQIAGVNSIFFKELTSILNTQSSLKKTSPTQTNEILNIYAHHERVARVTEGSAQELPPNHFIAKKPKEKRKRPQLAKLETKEASFVFGKRPRLKTQKDKQELIAKAPMAQNVKEKQAPTVKKIPMPKEEKKSGITAKKTATQNLEKKEAVTKEISTPVTEEKKGLFARFFAASKSEEKKETDVKTQPSAEPVIKEETKTPAAPATPEISFGKRPGVIIQSEEPSKIIEAGKPAGTAPVKEIPQAKNNEVKEINTEDKESAAPKKEDSQNALLDAAINTSLVPNNVAQIIAGKRKKLDPFSEIARNIQPFFGDIPGNNGLASAKEGMAFIPTQKIDEINTELNNLIEDSAQKIEKIFDSKTAAEYNTKMQPVKKEFLDYISEPHPAGEYPNKYLGLATKFQDTTEIFMATKLKDIVTADIKSNYNRMKNQMPELAPQFTSFETGAINEITENYARLSVYKPKGNISKQDYFNNVVQSILKKYDAKTNAAVTEYNEQKKRAMLAKANSEFDYNISNVSKQIKSQFGRLAGNEYEKMMNSYRKEYLSVLSTANDEERKSKESALTAKINNESDKFMLKNTKIQLFGSASLDFQKVDHILPAGEARKMQIAYEKEIDFIEQKCISDAPLGKKTETFVKATKPVIERHNLAIRKILNDYYTNSYNPAKNVADAISAAKSSPSENGAKTQQQNTPSLTLEQRSAVVK